MQIERYADPILFRKDCDTFLLEQAAFCSHIYTGTRSLTAQQLIERKLWLARMHSAGETRGVAVVITPFPVRTLAFSAFDDDTIASMLQALDRDGFSPDSLSGELETATRIAAHMGRGAHERFRLGNHILEQAPTIPVCAGHMRAATIDDYPLVLAWEGAFIRETGLPCNWPALESAIRERLQSQVALEWLWTIDGAPVAKAVGRSSAPIARIGGVYTPPECRRKGYAGALVGQLSAALQAQGCERVFLATDMANPTSNGVYRRLGYRFTGESTHLDLEPPTTDN